MRDLRAGPRVMAGIRQVKSWSRLRREVPMADAHPSARRDSLAAKVGLIATAFAMVLATALVPSGVAQEEKAKGKDKESTDETPKRVVKTNEQWAKILTPEQYMVTRLKATEPAGTGKYANSHAKGTYTCICCGLPLFSSKTKFDSGTGWPSFWAPVDMRNIQTAPDYHG